jgi:hypothetical protein
MGLGLRAQVKPGENPGQSPGSLRVWLHGADHANAWSCLVKHQTGPPFECKSQLLWLPSAPWIAVIGFAD